MSTSTALSPMRRLARTLGNLIHHDRIDTNSSISKILEILQKYLNNFDDCWTPLEQQNYLDKCETDIVAVLQHTEMSAATINIVHNEINKAFEEITNDLESFKTIELQDFHDLTTALADLKQTMQQIISRLVTELKAVKINVDSLKSEMKDLGNKVMKLGKESDFLKKMHFISDLFSPVMSKLHSMMLINNIPPNTLTKSPLEQLRQFLNHGQIGDEDLRSIAVIFQSFISEYKLDPMVAIDYLIKKKRRNETVHYTRKLKDYATSATVTERNLAAFLSSQPELDNQFFVSEINALNGLFVSVCEQLILPY
jgi:hypothetical protein